MKWIAFYGVNMTITSIEEIYVGRSKKKIAYKIYADEAYLFLLYSQDIRQYNLKVGEEINGLLYDKIVEETVYRRAKQRALATLKRTDKTEYEIRIRLKDAHYTNDIIDMTIEYLKNYNYINDERYASNYIRFYKLSRSKFVLRRKLKEKGINKDLLEEIISKEYLVMDHEIDPEIIALNKAISKKYSDISSLSWQEKQKLISSLYRKGFAIDKIQSHLKDIETCN